MDVKFDHLVHFLKNDPIEAVKKWAGLGYHTVIGGSHQYWGSMNSLLYLNSSYIEYLSIEDADKASHCDNPLISQLVSDIKKGEGFSQICFRTANLEKVKASLEEKGYTTFPIFNGSRKRKDGITIKWKMLFINENSELPSPFFIEWEQSDEERAKELKELKMVDPSLAENVIQSIFFAVNDCELAARKWARMFNLHPMAPPAIDSSFLSKAASVRIADTEIVFCEPIKNEGIVYDILNSRGERPFLIQFNKRLFNEPISLFSSFYY